MAICVKRVNATSSVDSSMSQRKQVTLTQANFQYFLIYERNKYEYYGTSNNFSYYQI